MQKSGLGMRIPLSSKVSALLLAMVSTIDIPRQNMISFTGVNQWNYRGLLYICGCDLSLYIIFPAIEQRCANE